MPQPKCSSIRLRMVWLNRYPSCRVVRPSIALPSRRFVEFGPVGMAGEMDQTRRVLSQSADAAEGVRSFLEKRLANFDGR